MADFNAVLNGAPGAARWLEMDGNQYLQFQCPCGCGHIINLPVTGPQAWAWDGNREQPTLNPSILNHPCEWHGYLRQGEWVRV